MVSEGLRALMSAVPVVWRTQVAAAMAGLEPLVATRVLVVWDPLALDRERAMAGVVRLAHNAQPAVAAVASVVGAEVGAPVRTRVEEAAAALAQRVPCTRWDQMPGATTPQGVTARLFSPIP